MKNAMIIAAGALALGLGSFAISPPASADHVTVAVGAPAIAFGYSDGYWDRDRRWHTWKDRDEAENFRRDYREHYYDWRHDRDHDRDLGWRDEDHWWDRH
jgi:hypothetical protein